LLLETLAYRVAREILSYDEGIASVTVAVRKLRPPVAEDVATVGVRCTVTRP
jgi:dihydroneopterin aldolase